MDAAKVMNLSCHSISYSIYFFVENFHFSISENSRMANAKFQAAAAIRDASLREWGILTSVDKRSLIRWFFLLLNLQFDESGWLGY